MAILKPRRSIIRSRGLVDARRGFFVKGTVASGVPAGGLVPPQQSSILHWFDFTDNSTTWQDTSATTPANANGESIARVDNKGSASDNPIQATGAAQPTLSNNYNGDFGLLVAQFDGGDTLEVTIASGLGEDAGGYSWAYVASHAATTVSDWVLGWESTLGLAAQGGGDDVVTMYTGGSGQFNTNTLTADEIFATAWVERTDDTQQMYMNLDASISSQANASNGPADSQDLVIGGINSGNASMDGYIAEIVIWNTELVAADITEWQNYTASKYGVTWA